MDALNTTRHKTLTQRLWTWLIMVMKRLDNLSDIY
jgi:hypothetical protein